MALNAQQRTSIVDWLTTNCDAWKGAGDREVLNGFTDEKLLHLKEVATRDTAALAVANAAVNGFSDGSTAYRINPQTGRWERRELATRNAGKKNYDEEFDPEDEEEDAEDDDMEEENKKRMQGKSTRNRATPQRRHQPTPEEILRSLPPEIQRSVAEAQVIVNQEKTRIVEEILANSDLPPANRQGQRDWLMGKDINDLRQMQTMMPRRAKPDPTEQQTRNRRGGRQRAQDEDMLGLPTLNWTEVGTAGNGGTINNGNNGQGKQTQRPEMVENDDYESTRSEDDEYLRDAPPNLRRELMEARQITRAERERIINDLTANVADPEAADRLAQRLQHKTLDELRDLAVVAPQSSGTNHNYFGQSTPLSNSLGITTNDGDDLLPLPKMDWSEVTRTK